MPSADHDEFSEQHENNSNETIAPDSDVLNVKGLNLAKNGEFVEAVLCFQKAVELNPNNAKAWYNYGTSLTQMGKFDEATLHCFERALEIDPNDAEAWNNKGSVLNILGRDEEALVCYQRAIEVAPGNGRAWKNMGAVFEKQGNKKSAKECYQKAAEAGLDS